MPRFWMCCIFFFYICPKYFILVVVFVTCLYEFLLVRYFYTISSQTETTCCRMASPHISWKFLMRKHKQCSQPAIPLWCLRRLMPLEWLFSPSMLSREIGWRSLLFSPNMKSLQISIFFCFMSCFECIRESYHLGYMVLTMEFNMQKKQVRNLFSFSRIFELQCFFFCFVGAESAKESSGHPQHGRTLKFGVKADWEAAPCRQEDCICWYDHHCGFGVCILEVDSLMLMCICYKQLDDKLYWIFIIDSSSGPIAINIVITVTVRSGYQWNMVHLVHRFSAMFIEQEAYVFKYTFCSYQQMYSLTIDSCNDIFFSSSD